MAYAEYYLEKYFLFPNGVPYYWLWIILGLCMVIGGEYLRKLSMCTAQQSFSHLIEDKPNSEHQLITHGIYQTYRHPSYVGWFWWACGTQILLANPICFILYLISTWRFFAERVTVVFLAFLAAIGFTLLILGCALSNYNWWPTFVIIFYVLCPIPLVIARQCTSSNGYSTSDTNPCSDLMWFITSAIVVSAFSLPVVLHRAGTIALGSMGFVMGANAIVFITIAVYFLTFDSDDSLLSI
ncbi:unnamed protein product [Adineta ricciae]|uniref:Protein-S-isoprenylcysteine O-methyltransferase n=1 Tax=Adineta ricciae TaxID=249248 RepID=A0A814GK02_ADIRI|nr:unnamed protein product [Adineta ricciae]CAF1129484.1 unnamed protein product [Adineta ricciae]